MIFRGNSIGVIVLVVDFDLDAIDKIEFVV